MRFIAGKQVNSVKEVHDFLREHRFVDHDAMENRLDRKWKKEGIEFIMKKFREGKNIDILIDKYAF